MPRPNLFEIGAFRSLMTTYRDAVRDHSARLNRLNVYPVPDGDTGTNMSRTLDAVVVEMEATSSDDLAATCDAISHGSLMGARGNSGVILSQVLRGVASTVKAAAAQGPETTAVAPQREGPLFADALTAAAESAYQAVLKPIEGTILTVVREAAEAAKAASGDGDDLVGVVRAARAEAEASLERTPELLPVLQDAGVVDAGGAGFVLFLDSALYLVDGTPVPEPGTDGETPADVQRGVESTPGARLVAPSETSDGIDVSQQRYEVMYFLDLDDGQIDAFKSGWGKIGDSIVVVGGDGIWNCHIHTNEIGESIELALTLGGRPKDIRVTDLFEEVDEEHARREAQIGVVDATATHVQARPGAGLPPVTTAVIAVSAGDGLAELFDQLGVQGFVRGGQTMNPSTAELLDVVSHVNADQVVILPNNSNIIAVAEQVDSLTDAIVRVVPTRTIAQALAALIVYDPEADADTNLVEMSDAASSVRSGEVTRAVRSTKTSVGVVTEGDWMGLVDGEGIVAIAPEIVDACIGLLDTMIAQDSELLTIIVGEDADDETTAAVLAWMTDAHADVQVEVHHGGQPLYPYLFGLE